LSTGNRGWRVVCTKNWRPVQGMALVTLVCTEISTNGELANDTLVTEWSARRNPVAIICRFAPRPSQPAPVIAVTELSPGYHLGVI
jgi:hypothetical protein